MSLVPQRSNLARHNFGILYDQFNEINFFVEDSGKEHFYFSIFKKLFPGIKFEKVIGLNGKENVKTAASVTENSKKDVYIVDLDFDSIFNEINVRVNLFYLNRYSIENYLIEELAFNEIIKEEKINISDAEINEILNLDSFTESIRQLLIQLFVCFPIVYKHQLSCGYYGLNIPRDIDFSTNPISFKGNYVSDYIQLVKGQLLVKNPELDFLEEISSFEQHFQDEFFHINSPGKYLMSLFKFKIAKEFGIISHSTDETFNIRVGKNCDLNSLIFLRENINRFIN